MSWFISLKRTWLLEFILVLCYWSGDQVIDTDKVLPVKYASVVYFHWPKIYKVNLPPKSVIIYSPVYGEHQHNAIEHGLDNAGGFV